MKKYGFRGKWELDNKNPRFNDNPKTIISQIFSSLLNAGPNKNPGKELIQNLKVL